MGRESALTQMRAVMGKTTKRFSTSDRKDSRLIESPICFLRNNVDSSYNVKSEMASPPSPRRASSMATFAFFESRTSFEASQTTTCVSRMINKDLPILQESEPEIRHRQEYAPCLARSRRCRRYLCLPGQASPRACRAW